MVTAGSFRAGGLFIFVKEMINIAIKLATSITYTADGSQTNFSIPFDYLRPSFVHVAVNDAEVSEGFTVSNRGIMFDTAPAKDALVKIYRKTPTSRLVSWADASILKAIDMTIAEVQQLHILEEASDWSKTNSIVLDEEGNTWQGRNCRMSNIADPVDAQDAVSKNYIDNEENSMMQRMNAIKTQTEQLMNTASNHKDNAYNSAQSASTSAASAAESARLAEGYKNVAETAKSDASLYAANAKTSADNAGASKEAAQSAANSASNFATDARSSANEAKSYRDAASTYATNAKNYSENVNVFVPSVSAEGVLSWSNKAGLTNPPSVNIKGKDGADGGVTVDAALSDSSTNPVQNKVIKGALDDKANLNKNNTFSKENYFQKGMSLIAYRDLDSAIKWYQTPIEPPVASIDATNYTGNAASATKATQDSAGNVITETYAKKTDISGVVKSVNGTKPDIDGNVNITVSGGRSGVTVDEELSSTSTNPVQNKTIYNALLNKAGTDIFSGFDLNSPSATIRWRNGSQNYGILTASNYSGTALRATQDGAGNIITETYAKKTDISNATVDATLSATSTNAIANKAVYSALSDKLGKTDTAYAATKATQDGAGNTITTTYAKKSDVEVELNNKLNKTDTAVAATAATRALQDGNGNVISSTYIKSVNNVTPDENGNVNITVSGGGSNVTVDSELSESSTNPVQNKVITVALNNKAALDEANMFRKKNTFINGIDLTVGNAVDAGIIKWYRGNMSTVVASIDNNNYTGNANTATQATQDSAGNVITETYAKKADVSGVVKSVNGTKPDANGNVSITVSGGSNVTVDTTLSATSNNAIANKAVYNALSGKLDKTGTVEYARKDSAGNVISTTYIKSVNNVKPDTNGNVNISVSGGDGVSLSEENIWTGKQTFQKMKFNFESYNAPRVSGATDNPSESVAVYNVQGNFTLDMSVLAGLLSNGDATLFTAYITANGSYTLSITNAGTLKYVGSATDLAITTSGLLLNILLIKNSIGDLSSVVQANVLS